MQIDFEKTPLPPFREDLQIYPGPNNEDGSPSYNVCDPISGGYFQFGWEQGLLIDLFEPGMTARDLKKAIEANSTLRIEEADLWDFFAYADACHLIKRPFSAKKVEQEWKMRRLKPWTWILHHYLYFRIPLLRPDAFLGKTLPFVRFLASPMARKIYLFITLFGLILLLGRLDTFLHTFSTFFNWKGAFAYFCTIPLVKVIHEFSHAYVAKAQGVTVPTMGIALMVFHPVAYCDVTDGWKLRNRSKRMWITLAGVCSEIVLAGLSTLGWVFTEPGLLHNIFFILASSNWITSILVNLSPLMRFDGYYFFSDLIGVDNLQQRAFQWTRWKLREWFLGLGHPPPESFSLKKQCIIFCYTIATWIYRFLLYLGIAFMVYYVTNIKPLALFLFGIEMVFFVIRPFYLELRVLWKMRSSLHLNSHLVATSLSLIVLFFWAVLPLSHSQVAPAVVILEKEVFLYAPSTGAFLKKMWVREGEFVQKGQLLFSLYLPFIENAIAVQEKELAILEKEILAGQLDRVKEKIKDHNSLLVRQTEWAKKRAEMIGLQELLKQQYYFAPFDGFFYGNKRTRSEGQAILSEEVLGKVGTLHRKKVRAFIPEKRKDSIQKGDLVSFFSHHQLISKGKVIKRDDICTHYLSYPQLASTNQSPLEVVREPKGFRLVDAYYEMEMALDSEEQRRLRVGQIGQVRFQGEPYSIIWKLIQTFFAIFHRESSL